MSDLAYNINGEAFELPAAATGWRVRRMKTRGAPEVVYGRDGLPLVLSIESDHDELRRNVEAPGRFRLDAIDDRGRTIDSLPAAYVMVPTMEAVTVPESTAPRVPSSDSVIAEAMRLNTELARAVIDRFPEMMTAAAELVRAADGAGIPARLPRVLDTEHDDEDDDGTDATAPSAFDLNALVAQLVPLLIAGLGTGKVKAPKLAEMLDWRKAARASGTTDASGSKANEPVPATPAMPPLDAATMAHFVAVQATLTPDEGELARELASELAPAELRAWIDELSKLSVPDAATKIRTVIHGGTAGVS